MGQGLGFLIDQKNVVVHAVADHQISPNNRRQGIVFLRTVPHGIGHTGFHFSVNGVADQVEDVFLGGDVLIERTDGETRCGRNLPGRGFVEAIRDEELDGGVDDLASSALHQILILDLGGNVTGGLSGGTAHTVGSFSNVVAGEPTLGGKNLSERSVGT